MATTASPPTPRPRLLGADLAFRWRPLRRARYQGFVGRTEFVWSRLENGGPVQNAFGMYASAEYQFARRWFAACVTDLSDRAYDDSIRDEGVSALVTFWPSEFSQVRAQYRRTVSATRTAPTSCCSSSCSRSAPTGAHPF